MRLSRRTLLKTAAAAIPLPFLEAFGQSQAPPPRFVIFTWSNGSFMDRWTPVERGTGWSVTESLQPLASRRDDLTLVTGLTNMPQVKDIYFQFDINHHPLCTSMLLTGGLPPIIGPLARPDSQQGDTKWVTSAAGPSVDQVVAQAWAGQTAVPSLSVYAELPAAGTPNHRYSWKGVDDPATPFGNPKLLFDYLFGGVPSDPGQAERIRRKRLSILDGVKQSSASLKARLGRDDNQRLDRHLEAIRALELRISKTVTCTRPSEPGPAAGWEPFDRIRDRIDALIALSAMALACDLTRVLVFSLGESAAGIDIQWMNLGNNDHGLAHWMKTRPGDDAKYTQLTTYKMSVLAKFLDALQGVSEGSRTLLDSSLVAALSEFSDGGVHLPEMVPVILAGGLGNRRKEHVVVPCTPSSRMLEVAPRHAAYGNGGTTQMATLWHAALQALGVSRPSFGVSTSPLTGVFG